MWNKAMSQPSQLRRSRVATGFGLGGGGRVFRVAKKGEHADTGTLVLSFRDVVKETGGEKG